MASFSGRRSTQPHLLLRFRFHPVRASSTPTSANINHTRFLLAKNGYQASSLAFLNLVTWQLAFCATSIRFLCASGMASPFRVPRSLLLGVLLLLFSSLTSAFYIPGKAVFRMPPREQQLTGSNRLFNTKLRRRGKHSTSSEQSLF